MIRQLSMNGLKFRTPNYADSLEAHSELSGQYHRVNFAITEESSVVLCKPEIGAKFSKTVVDILGYVKNIPFVVYVTYKDRSVPAELDPPDCEICGVVAVDVSGLLAFFKKEREGRYVEVLREFIEEISEGKSWVYHPHAAMAREQAEIQMEQWLSQQKVYRSKATSTTGAFLQPQQSKPEAPVPPECKAENYRCIMCGAHWTGVSPHCKKCDTHLFTTVSNGFTGGT